MTGYDEEPDYEAEMAAEFKKLRAELASVSDALVRLANGVMRDGLGQTTSTPLDIGYIVDSVKACRAWGNEMKEALEGTCVRSMGDQTPCWCEPVNAAKTTDVHGEFCKENRAEWASRGGGWPAVTDNKHDAATNNLFKRIHELEGRLRTGGVQALEERVAFAEQARDNAIAQRDVVIERSKAEAQTAGRIISQLKALVGEYANDPPKTGSEVRARLKEILGDDDEKTT